MDYVETDMLETCTEASKFLEEDKYMKRAQEEHEALRIAEVMNKMAAEALQCVSLRCAIIVL
jgi:hypothetical protein